MKTSISCGTLTYRIVNQQVSILLIKQFAHKESWGIPKGHIDADESYEDCAVRETREETGVRVILENKLPEMTTFWRDEHKQVISYLARPMGDSEPNCSDPDCEVADVRWFDINDLPQLHVYQRAMISEACEILKTK